MKRCIALLMALVMLMSATAFAEEAVYNWEIPADAVGETWTTTLHDKNIAFKVFVYEGWEYQDSSTYLPHVRAMWATEDGRKLELGFATHEEAHVNTMEDVVPMVESAGYSYDIQTINGMPACLVSSEDMLSDRGMIAVLPEGVLMVHVTNLTDESQIDEADNMIYSVTPKAIEEPDANDVGIKESELDFNAGWYMPISGFGTRMMIYLTNDYEDKDVERDDTWKDNMVARRVAADGRKVDLYVYTLEELEASNLTDVYEFVKASENEAEMDKINGLDVICFWPPDKSHKGIALLFGEDHVLVIKAGPIQDAAQNDEVSLMFRSIRPAPAD